MAREETIFWRLYHPAPQQCLKR